jgi:hypothetical protein
MRILGKIIDVIFVVLFISILCYGVMTLLTNMKTENCERIEHCKKCENN